MVVRTEKSFSKSAKDTFDALDRVVADVEPRVAFIQSGYRCVTIPASSVDYLVAQLVGLRKRERFRDSLTKTRIISKSSLKNWKNPLINNGSCESLDRTGLTSLMTFRSTPFSVSSAAPGGPCFGFAVDSQWSNMIS